MRLLLPVFGREETQILRAFLVVKNALDDPNFAIKAQILSAMTKSDRKKGMEGLLFSSLLSHKTNLTSFLLDEGISPKDYSDGLKRFALEWCASCGADEQVGLLLEFGANPKNPQFKKWPKMPADLVTRIMSSLAP